VYRRITDVTWTRHNATQKIDKLQSGISSNWRRVTDCFDRFSLDNRLSVSAVQCFSVHDRIQLMHAQTLNVYSVTLTVTINYSLL